MKTIQYRIIVFISRIFRSTALVDFLHLDKIHNLIMKHYSECGVYMTHRNLSILLDPTESVFEYIKRGEDPEPEVSNVISRLVSPGDVAFDVGCRFGVQTLEMYQQVGSTGEVHAFDAFPKHCRFLEQTKEKNNIENIYITNAAICNEIGEISINIPENTTASITENSVANKANTMRVRSLRLCKYIDDNGIQDIDFIKVDVEGSELDLIKGLGRKIQDDFTMIIEIHDELLTQRELQELSNYLTHHGRLKSTDGSGLSSTADLYNNRQVLWEHESS